MLSQITKSDKMIKNLNHYNDSIIKLQQGDIFVVPKDKFINYFKFSKNNDDLSIYIDHLQKPFFNWSGNIFGTFPKLLIESVLKSPFNFLKQFLQDQLINSLSDDYVFGFPYVGNGWVMVSEKSGVYLYKVNFHMLKNVDVFRINQSYDPMEYQKILLSFWNLPTNYSPKNPIKDILLPFLSFLNIEVNDDPLFTKQYEQLEIPLSNEIKTLCDVELIVETFRRIDINLLDGDGQKKDINLIVQNCTKLF